MMRPLDRFPGGIHPEEHKTLSCGRPIHPVIVPSRLVIPLNQHIGQPAKPIVKVGDKVLKGQMIGQAEGYVSTAVHASSSGVVTAIGPHAVPHPSGLPDLCITIETDGKDEWIAHQPLDWRHLDPAALRGYIRDMGLAGLGGAVFPTSVKLDPGQRDIPTLILNGGECEPWITSDDLLMRERAADILRGAEIMQHMLQAGEVLVGIEDNKPEAIAAMRAAAQTLGLAAEIVAVPTIYPGGGAKQLTKTLTGKESAYGMRSADIGVQVFNVGTAYALARAILHGEPLISRIVTVTGHVREAQNYEVLIGTPMQDLVSQAGVRDGITGLIMGGPMMGFDVPSADAPVVKATNCILVKSAELFPPKPRELPCIRCTQCAIVCPAQLQPQELYWFARAKNFGKAQEYNLFDCIECGCCSYVCPSHIPLVDYYRFAKSEIWAREREKKAADIARERHEFHLFRLEREKKEKAERLAAKAHAKKSEAPKLATEEQDAKKKLIADALARAQAKKADIVPKNTDDLTPEQRAEIAEIENRRTKIRETAKHTIEPEQP